MFRPRPTILAIAMLFAAGAAIAGEPVGRADAGNFIFDQQHSVLGSLVGFTADGQQAIVMYGLFRQPGSHRVVIPANRLTRQDGKIVLDGLSADAVASLPSFKG